MGPVAVGYSPGHISGFFRAVCSGDPAISGSVGGGIVIAEGVWACVSAADETRIVVHSVSGGRAVTEEGSPPLAYVLRRLGIAAEVTTVCRLPIGSGFGLSAASILASLAALNSLYSLGLSRAEIAALAHESEIVHRTGLGDVAACQGGGVACRKGPGTRAEIVRCTDVREPIFAVTFGPLDSPTVLRSAAAMERVAAAYPPRFPRDIRDFFALSRSFAEKSGLVTPEVAEVLAACDAAGVPASMTMLGRGVFALGEGARAVLSEFGEEIPLTVAKSGFGLREAGG